MATAYYSLVITVLPASLKLVSSVLYSISLVGLVVSGCLSTFTDPTDYVVVAERKARHYNRPFDTKPYRQICTICKTHVLEESKHCGQCDRCVDGFDHHCKWLNNCIGSRNYRYFLVLITFFEILSGLQASFSAYILHLCNDSTFLESTENSLGLHPASVYITLLVIQTTLSLVIFLIIGQLIVLHIWLRIHGLTTYEYIMNRRKKRRKERVSPIKEVNTDISVIRELRQSKESSVMMEEPDAEMSLTRRKHRKNEVVPEETLSRMASG